MQLTAAFFQRSYQGNIPKFYVYRFLYNFMLWLPIWVIYLQEKRGLSLSQVTLVDFIFWMTMVVSEVPTGAVADTLGRKQSQLIGLLLSTGSILLFAYAPTYPLLLLANCLWAIAITFISGAELAFFYDTLRALGRQEEYTKLRGRLSALTLTAVGISSGLGGLIAEYDLQLPFLIHVVLMAATLLLIIGFKEPPLEPDPTTGEQLSYLGTLQVSLRTVKQHINLRYALLFSTLSIVGPALIGIVFIQPHAVAIGIPLRALGLVLLGLRGVQVFSSYNAEKWVQRLGEWNALRLASVLVITGLLGLGMVLSPFGIAFLGLAYFGRAASGPLTESLILRQTPSSVRATILSFDSLIFRLFLAFIELPLGLLGDRRGLPVVFMSLAIGVGVSLSLLLAFWSRVWVVSSVPSES